MAAMIYKLEIDQADLRETLVLVQQIEATALRAKAALALIDVIPAQEFVPGVLVADETPGLILAELRKQTRLMEPGGLITRAA